VRPNPEPHNPLDPTGPPTFPSTQNPNTLNPSANGRSAELPNTAIPQPIPTIPQPIPTIP